MTQAALQTLGRHSLDWVAIMGQISRFGGQLAAATVTPPFRLRRLLDEVFDIGVRSIAIVCVSGVTVGIVLGLQGYNTLTRFGAEEQLGALVGLSLVRELGPVLTALLVTGRAGSSIAANIGAMVVTEQLDGLRMMSVDPVHFVAAPKAVAMVVVMPLLSALFIVSGMAGSYLIGVEVLGVDGGSYLSSLESSLLFNDDVAGSLIKSLVFGVLVGLIATYYGYNSEQSAEGVSRATTATVVRASVWTLIFNYFITAFLVV